MPEPKDELRKTADELAADYEARYGEPVPPTPPDDGKTIDDLVDECVASLRDRCVTPFEHELVDLLVEMRAVYRRNDNRLHRLVFGAMGVMMVAMAAGAVIAAVRQLPW